MADGNTPNGSTTIAQGQLRSFVERIERLEEEKAALAADIKEVYAEAKGNGFDTKVMRKVISLRKKDTAERQEEEAMLELYLHALGMLGVGILLNLGPSRAPSRALTIAGASFQVGIVLFSGTLYSFGQFMIVPVEGAAPLGGGLMILGWLLLGVQGARHVRRAP